VAIVLSFNGALNAALILIICPVTLLYFFLSAYRENRMQNVAHRIIKAIKSIPVSILFIFSFACLLCLYSLYIGKNNSENLWQTISLSERYARLPRGLYLQLTEKPGPLLLIFMILVNMVIIRRNNPDSEARQYLKMLRWFFALSLIYIILLPLGGYRYYRPNIVRMDTIMPVTLGMILFYGFSTFHIIKHVALKRKAIYYAGVIIFAGIFISADTELQKQNKCERNALEKISRSKDEIILLDSDCTVMSWSSVKDYHDSEVKTELLRCWGITKEKKYFYQQ
jgi:TRAP-type C4-dicarboxylate transport system permease small subunit